MGPVTRAIVLRMALLRYGVVLGLFLISRSGATFIFKIVLFLVDHVDVLVFIYSVRLAGRIDSEAIDALSG